ncbi:MAG TPA: hypothetical protein VKV36_00090 [Acidimicrobiales bacterium]|nr:hypothetical protein [Acidimicrobiales bacterium]
MSSYLPFVVIGLTTGSVYALAATGLVLTYKTSRVFNFAHGSMATVAVLLFFALVDRGRIGWQLAAAVAVVGIGPALGIAFELVGRRLTPLTTEAKVLATIGVVLFVSGGVALWGAQAFGGGPPASHPALPGDLVRILGGLAAAAVGAIVAIPAIRVAGIYLAVATFGFGVLLE